ncbi:cip1-interacting zinc finger protein isoform X2 [Balearica regulorum gibbericeps]|uniref:cip1-interacting zinc finger protein isoform X2 n=1 Tax=Balearica regulorum gibbericeps TaxID=100784 RepID=UPI003F61E42B
MVFIPSQPSPETGDPTASPVRGMRNGGVASWGDLRGGSGARPARGSPDMFNQQQFQQQLLQLQHLLQQQQQHHPPAQQGGRGLPPPQQQQMLSLRATNQPSLLNANPMLQRALLMQQMQGNLRGFNMTAPALQQFFPQATRHSLLGPPPVGVSLKPTRLGFPSLPFQRQNRTFRKDFQRVPDRKRELDPGSSSQTQGDEKMEVPEGVQAGSEQNNSSPSTEPRTPTESVLNMEPAAKRLKSVTEESALEDATDSKEAGESSTHVQADGTDNAKEYTAEDLSKERKFSEEPKAPEVLSSGGSLKVTIQQSSESRAISTTALKPGHWTCEVGTADPNPESVLKFYCYICKTNCCSQQNFQSHMAGIQHQQRLGEIQHMSNVCFVSLLPMVKEQKVLAEKDGETQQRWCNTCQIHFTGDLIKHRRTQEHKLAKRSLRPFCTVCSRHFKTPRKFVEHMKSPEHKQKAKEVRLGEKELGSPEDSEELITVDAVGCFEDDDDEEEEEEEGGAGEEEDLDVVLIENEDSAIKQTGLKEVSLEDYEGSEKYCPDTAYGLDFLVPVAGYLCRLCHKFYHSDSAARLAHCKSLMHFENFQGSSSQLLDDPKHPPATTADNSKMNDDYGTDKEGTELSALQEQTSRSPEGKGELATSVAEGKSLASVTDDVCGITVVEDDLQEESKSTTTSADCLLPEENRTVGELLGHAVSKEEQEEANAARQREGTDNCQDPGSGGGLGQNEAANAGQEAAAEPSSLAKGETVSLTSAGCRRSTRRKPR